MNDLISRGKLLDSLPKNDTVLSLDVRRIVMDAHTTLSNGKGGLNMEWISVKDRLPEREQHDYVLVCCTMNVTSKINYENAVTMAYVCEEGFMDVELNEVITRGVTHWMPLPEPPAGTAEGGQPVTAKRLSVMLVLALAAIALTVCAGLAAGVSMWPWIVAYWAVLTAKNITDYVGGRRK